MQEGPLIKAMQLCDKRKTQPLPQHLSLFIYYVSGVILS